MNTPMTCSTCNHYLPAHLSCQELKDCNINTCCHPGNYLHSFAVKPTATCGRWEYNQNHEKEAQS